MVGGEGVGERRKCGREGFEDIKMRNKEEDDGDGKNKDRGGEGRMEMGEEGGRRYSEKMRIVRSGRYYRKNIGGRTGGGEGRMEKGEEGGMEREDENSKVGKI